MSDESSYNYLIKGPVEEEYVFQSISKVFDRVPPGIYEADESLSGDPTLKKVSGSSDEIFELPDKITEALVDRLNNFWSADTRRRYNEMNLVYRYGILLYGPPGTGKSTAVKRVCNTVVDMGGVAIYNSFPAHVIDAVPAIRSMNPDAPVVVVFEDIEDNFPRYESDILDLMDGHNSSHNIVFIATTNYIEKIPPRFKSRPGRFAEVIKAEYPAVEARRYYVEKKLPGATQLEVMRLVEASEGMSIDHLRFLIVKVHCLGHNLDSALEHVKSLQESQED